MMMDAEKREKVIRDLDEQITWIRDNDFHKFPGWGHAVLAMTDALALLKAQEPVSVIYSHDYTEGIILRCPKCKDKVYKYNGNYCPHCGQAVKWE